jgi:DtxR family Mn-dependent transcriptional regulator
MITVSKEDYLKAILEAEYEGENVISATLAHWLKVSPPAVTMALRRLKNDAMVQVRADGRVVLTATGRAVARRTINRHHLIERMLSEVFELEWYKVHDEAERLEHAVSADFEAKLVKKLGSGGACPHGNLTTPENPASRRKRGMQLLSEAAIAKAYTVTSVFERDRGLLEFLDERGIRPGSRLTIAARNYDQTLTISNSTGTVSVGSPVAEKVWVRATREPAASKRHSSR